MASSSDDVRERLVALAWSQWNELGVAGVGRPHTDHAIDPESLVLLTAWLGAHDPRLRDESIDWCCTYGRFISGTRLKNLLAAFPDEVRQAFGRYSATVNAHSPQRWAAASVPYRMKPSGRSHVRSFSSASTLRLRLRGLMGVGARAEIITTLLAAGTQRFGAADLAARTQFGRRNVAEELEALRLAGVVAGSLHGKRQQFALADRALLEPVARPLPPTLPPWPDLTLILVEAVRFLDTTHRRSRTLRTIEADKLIARIQPQLSATGLDRSLRTAGTDDAFEAWLPQLVEGLATAQASAHPWILWRIPPPEEDP